jgi:hypothetical protein
MRCCHFITPVLLRYTTAVLVTPLPFITPPLFDYTGTIWLHQRHSTIPVSFYYASTVSVTLALPCYADATLVHWHHVTVLVFLC